MPLLLGLVVEKENFVDMGHFAGTGRNRKKKNLLAVGWFG